MIDLTLDIRIITPRGVLFQDKAYSLSSKNSLGKFDILPMHANFITVIENSPIIVRKKDNQIINFNFPIAIIHQANGKVNVYTDIQSNPFFE